MNLLGSFVIAFSMYSRIPMPKVEWTGERMKYAMCFFPLVGVVIGLLEMALWTVCGRFGFFAFQRIFPLVFPILVTGGIHMDGLLDVIDAKSSYGDKEKKLEILKDSHTGAFAIIGCSMYLLLYFAAFQEIRSSIIPAYCMIFPLTRSLSGLSVVTFPMAKKSGLAAEFSGAAEKKVVKAAMLFYLVSSELGIWYLGGSPAALTVLLICLFVFWRYYAMAKREFGGINGDLAGYFLQVCELALTVGLAILSHWR